MGRLLTTVLLCGASMLGSAMIASQGFAPDPVLQEDDASRIAQCEALDDENARRDCLDLQSRQVSRQ
jgi:hypothetical protein